MKRPYVQEASPAIEAHIDSSRVQHALIIGGTLVVAIFTYWIARLALGKMAARTLAIFVIASLFWATEVLPLFATAFVVIGLEILLLANDGGMAGQLTQLLLWWGLDVEPGAGEQSMAATTFLNPLAKDIIILFMGGFLLSRAMTKHGVDQVIAGKLLWPFVRSPLTLIYGLLGISAFFSMWMSNTAAAAMLIAIANPLLKLLPEDSRFRYAIVLAVPFGANVGGIGTPIGTPPNAIAYGALNAAGYEVTFLKWVLVAAPLEILLLAVIGLLLYTFYKPPSDLSLGSIEATGEISARGKTTLIILGITIMLWLTSGQHGVQAGAIALLAAAALTALGVLDRHDVGSIDWDILILMWGGLSLGVAMQQSGLTAHIARADLLSLPGGTWTIAGVVAFISVGLSTFMSNTATAALLIPMALALHLPGREQFAMLAVLACSCAMALPVSTPPNAIAYATGKVPLKAMLNMGGLISVIALILLLLGYRVMLPLIF